MSVGSFRSARHASGGETDGKRTPLQQRRNLCIVSLRCFLK